MLLQGKNIDLEQSFFYGFIAFFIITTSFGILNDAAYLAVIPLGILFMMGVVTDTRILYYAFFALIPFSVEVQIGSFGTDLPSEPLMLLLSGIAILLFISKIKSINASYITHPVSLFVILHLTWILFTALFAEDPVIGIKFLLAKSWYIIPFYGLTMYMMYSYEEMKKAFMILMIFLSIAVLYVLIRHAAVGFDYNMYNKVVQPIFRNHVNYAAMLVVVLPFVWALYRTDRRKILWASIFVLIVIGIYFSYTRAAQGCIVLGVALYIAYRMKLSRVMISSAAIVLIALSAYLVNNNKYMDFAPDFEKTITQRSYENLLDATLKMEDISTMERVYRWVAGGFMISNKPLTGYGPNNFYNNYHKYTVTSFKTYVSDNPEKSGIHNYYLMTVVEQGIIGLLIYLGLVILLIFKGEQVYHRLRDEQEKIFVMAATLCISIISILQLMNDLLESDKIGPFFFISAAIIVIYDIKSRKL